MQNIITYRREHLETAITFWKTVDFSMIMMSENKQVGLSLK